VTVPKLPSIPDPLRLLASEPEHRDLDAAAVLWRIHRTTGEHVAPWSQLRRYGPIPWCRFDPHPPGPPRLHRDIGVLYAAADLPTALAEVFQLTRVVDRTSGAPAVSAFRLTRGVRLLDLTGTWPLRAGASHVLNTDGRRDVTQAWARGIIAAWPELDGLRHTSSLTGRDCVTLFGPAATALPPEPLRRWSLLDPTMSDALARATMTIGYQLV
jgi:hypothetical protein